MGNGADGPEERHVDGATGNVPIGNHPHDTAIVEGRVEGASRVAQADDVHANRAACTCDPGLERRILERLHRRRHVPAGPGDREQRRVLDRAEMHRHEDHRAGLPEGIGHRFGGLDDQATFEVFGAAPGQASHVEVIADRLSERGPNDVLQGAVVGGGAADHLATQISMDQMLRDTAQVLASADGTSRRQPIPEHAGCIAERVDRTFRQDDKQPRCTSHEARPDTLSDRRHGLRCGDRGGHAASLLSMTAARASSASRSAGSAGQIGLKQYHWVGSGAMVAAKASAIACVARWRSAGLFDGTMIGGAQLIEKVRPSGFRWIVIGRIREPVLAASVAGPAGSVVQASNSRTGMPSAR